MTGSWALPLILIGISVILAASSLIALWVHYLHHLNRYHR